MANSAALYTSEVLGLATSLARFPADPALPLHGDARSPACGSRIELGLALDGAGRIERIGLSAHACAIGQASAAIFANAATGRSQAEIAACLAGLEAWLAGTADLPDWPGLDAIAAARAFPGRHGAILLAWRAAISALSQEPKAG